MSLPFDSTKPEIRDRRVTFYTDDEVGGWLDGQAGETELGLSLLCHRIIKQAKESTPLDGERHQTERRAS